MGLCCISITITRYRHTYCIVYASRRNEYKIRVRTTIKYIFYAVAYTRFAESELQKAGLAIPTTIIPHGVDTMVFYPEAKEVARDFLHMNRDWFVVNITDRNAMRKRIDLGFRILCSVRTR